MVAKRNLINSAGEPGLQKLYWKYIVETVQIPGTQLMSLYYNDIQIITESNKYSDK